MKSAFPERLAQAGDLVAPGVGVPPVPEDVHAADVGVVRQVLREGVHLVLHVAQVLTHPHVVVVLELAGDVLETLVAEGTWNKREKTYRVWQYCITVVFTGI